MTQPTPKQLREAQAHDRMAADYQDLEADCLDLHPQIQRLLAEAGDLQGLTVLECGCGRGLFTEYLVAQGAQVIAFDISQGMIALAQKRLAGNPQARFIVSPLETLDLPEASFDLIIGLDILHHIDLSQSLPLLKKWLKPEGKALFLENFGFNPLLAWSRVILAGRIGVAKYGTDDERPLSRADVALMRHYFNAVRLLVPEMIFLHIINRNVLRYRYAKPVQRLLDAVDRFLYRFPVLHWLSYKVIVILS